MKIIPRWLRSMVGQVIGEKRKKPIRRRRSELQVEVLEDRITPTIVFDPFWNPETVIDLGGYTLRSPPVHFLFWGSYWQTGQGPAQQTQIVDAARNMFASAYFSAQTQYRTDGKVVMGSVANEAADPQPRFSDAAINYVLLQAIQHGRLPEADAAREQAMYVVFTPPGVLYEPYGLDAAGWNTALNDLVFAWVGGGNTENTMSRFSLDSYTTILSHEISEAITNPQTAPPMGFKVNPPANLPNPPANAGQISDYECEWNGKYAYRVNGVLVQAYWSKDLGKFVVPDGTQQKLELVPQYNGNYYITKNQLIINGDFGSTINDVIRVETSSRLDPNPNLLGGLVPTIKVTWNGETAEFDENYIGAASASQPGIIIKTGSGYNTVDLTHYDSLIPIEVQDGATTSVSISDAQVKEGDSGSSSADFQLTLGSNTTVIDPTSAVAKNFVYRTHGPVSVTWTTVLSGTAAAGDMYSWPAYPTLYSFAQGGDNSFVPVEYSAPIHVLVKGDTRMERDETFGVVLTNSVGAEIYDNFGLGTIIDDDVEGTYTTPTGPFDISWGSSSVPSTPGFVRSLGRSGNVELDADGRAVTFCTSDGSSSPRGSYVNRYNPNGTLDTTFNGTGQVYATVSSTYLVEPDPPVGTVYQSGPNRGKILTVVGFHGSNLVESNQQIIRLNLDGSRDMTFGGGTGYAAFNFPIAAGQPINQLVIDKDGYILAVGGSGFFQEGSHLLMARYTPNGLLDTSFGTDGKIDMLWHYTDNAANILPYGYMFGHRALIDSQNRILVAGYAGLPGTYQAGAGGGRSNGGFVLRLMRNGGIDPSFGTDGITFIDYQPFRAAILNDMVLDDEGRITVCAANGAVNNIARLTPDGQLDSTFGYKGYVNLRSASSLLLEGSGNLVVGGTTAGGGGITNNFFMARYNTAGVPDTTFDTVEHDNFLSPSIGAFATFGDTESVLLPNGNYLLYGQEFNRNGNNLLEATAVAYESQRSDLSVTMTTETAQAPGGGTVTYTIRVRNNGDDAIFASLRDVLPSELTFVSMTVDSKTPASGPWADSKPNQFTNGTITAAVRNLKASDGEQVFTITAAVKGNLPTYSKFTNTVEVSSANMDPDSTNNTKSVTLPVTPLLADISDASIGEGNGGGAVPPEAVFTISLNRPSWQTVTVDFATGNGGTAVPGTDFTPTSGTVTFAPGETAKTIRVPIVGDTQLELDETFIVNLRNPTNALVRDNMGLGTIVDDEWAVLTPQTPMDAAFGTNGLVDQPIPGLNVTSFKVAVDSNGRPVSLGILNGNVVLTRHNPNGQLDTTFGGGTGIVVTPLTNNVGISLSLAIVRSGPDQDKILVGGSALFGLAYASMVRRYNVDGTVDTQFGTNGMVQVDFPTVYGTTDYAFDIAVYEHGPNEGRLLVTGPSYLARFNADGTRDTKFDPVPHPTLNPTANDGFVPLNLGGILAIGHQTLATADDKVLVAGRFGEAGNAFNAMIVARYNADATLDTTFGGGQGFVVVAHQVPGYLAAAYGLALDGAGRILVSGSNGQTAVLARLTANGTLDASFGSAGLLLHSFGIGYGEVAIAADGKIVATGWAPGPTGGTLKAIVTRLNEDGRFDDTFDSMNRDGVIEIASPTRSYAGVPLALTADGKIVLNLQNASINGDDGHFLLARIEDDRVDLAVDVGTTQINQVALGDTVLFNVCVTNQGATLADRFTVSMVMPTNAVFVSATGDYTRVGNTIYWRGANLGAGQEQHFHLIVQATAAGYVQGSATVIPRVPDTDPADNTVISVIGSPSTGIDPPSGLVGLWHADGSAIDKPGDNNGLLINGATFAAGRFGQAFSFDGVNDYVQIGARANLVMTNALTLEAWIFPTGPGSAPGEGGVIINKEGEYEFVRFPNGTIQWAIANPNNQWPVWNNTGFVAPLNQWSHVALVYNNGIVTFYGNGNASQPINNGIGNIGDTTTALNDFRIGGRQYNDFNYTQYFAGRIDEVGVFNRALSASEIRALAASPISVQNQPPTIAAAQPLVQVDEGQTATISGVLNDPDGDNDCVFVFASIGAVSQDPLNPGNWTWSLGTTDGPDQSQPVTITVNDGHGGITSTTFQLDVNNVAPSIGVSGPADVEARAVYELTLGQVTDPGQDSVFQYVVHWGDASNTYVGNPQGQLLTHVYENGPANYAITIDLTDEDGTFHDRGNQLTVVVGDGDGVPASVENAAPNGGDGNNDGTLDSLQANVASLPSATPAADYITLESPSGTALALVRAVGDPPAGLPQDAKTPVGVFDFNIVHVTPGEATTIVLFMPSGQKVNEYWLHDANGWYQFTWNGITGATFEDRNNDGTNDVVLHLVDGQFGDTDGLANGSIVDPGAPVYKLKVATNHDAVATDEGQAAANSGTFDGVGVTVTASIGSINMGDGTWTWSYLTSDGPDQSQSVTITATDGELASVSTTFTFVVGNVAPTLVIFGNASVDEGSPYTLNLSSSDPGTDTIDHWTITWGDGDVEAVAGNPSSVTHTYADGDNSYTISATATDEDGTFAANAIAIAIDDVAPTFEAGRDQTLLPSVVGAFDRAGIQIIDPGSPEDFSGTVDFGDGTVQALTINQASRQFDLSHKYTADGVYEVSVTVDDGDGGSHTDSFQVTVVLNSPPTITSLTSSAPDCGRASISTPVTISGAFSDPDIGDLHHAVIDWGDGQQTLLGETNPAIDQVVHTFWTGHTYTIGGAFTVTVTLFDQAGEESTRTTSAVVSGVGLHSGVLEIIGSAGRDVIHVNQYGSIIRVDARLDIHWHDHDDDLDCDINDDDEDDDVSEHDQRHQHFFFNAADVTSISIDACAGNDNVRVGRNITLTTTIDGGLGDDHIWGGSGDDIITDFDGNNRIYSRGGNDTITVGDSNNRIWTDGGGDTIVAGNGNNDIWTGDGNDQLTVGNGCNSIRTDGGDDIIITGNGNNEIDAGAGDDVVTTGSGNDYIDAGAGNDLVRAGAGNDIVYGRTGNDILLGGDGDDTLVGGDGRDLIIAGSGKDTIVGDGGDDLLIAGSTAYDTHDAALLAILQEWTSDNSYNIRVANIVAGSGLSGGFHLVADDGALHSIFNDNEVDTLWGKAGQDWFMANRVADNGGLLDIVKDQANIETWSDTDF